MFMVMVMYDDEDDDGSGGGDGGDGPAQRILDRTLECFIRSVEIFD